MSILDVRNLQKSYSSAGTGKKVHAVRDVTFSIKKGEIFGLLGPNGAGKSTTINILSGLLHRDAGTIRMFGRDFDANQEYVKQRMNVASAYFGLTDIMSVQENLTMYAMLYGIKNRKEKIQALLQKFKIEGLRHKKSFHLSSGERTRMNLCKGLLNDPELLLLDECTVGLDPEIAEATRRLILDYKEQRGLSILFTSHYMSEVEQLCNRVAFLSHGRILKIDTAHNLKKLIRKQAVEIRFLRHCSWVPAFLRRKGIPVLSSDERSVSFEVSTATDELYKLMNQLFQKGMKVKDLHIKRPTLDDVFIHIAKQKMR